ncbi:hypothetical protein ACMDCR_25795 [Labrys okinawensis]|uniref:hypothetical protein n=1 Tax=Labrys okinawensis TaxID=346911 RepID=UPI0039BC9B81
MKLKSKRRRLLSKAYPAVSRSTLNCELFVKSLEATPVKEVAGDVLESLKRSEEQSNEEDAKYEPNEVMHHN